MAVDHRDIEDLAKQVFLEIVSVMGTGGNHSGKTIASKAYELAEAFLEYKK